MSIINPNIYSQLVIKQISEDFRTGRPFKNVCIPNFLLTESADHLFENFPPIEKMRKKYNGINERKAEDASFDSIDHLFTALKNELGSSVFLKWLENITGIDDLSTVVDQRGAGLHQGEDGSFLDIHIDFNIHPLLNIHRRLNLIIFFNKDWEESWGGSIEFWDKQVKQCVTSYQPIFNSCIIFETNEISYHGYSKINVPKGVTRKSYYNYFYTPLNKGIKYHDTIFKARPQEGFKKAFITSGKDVIKNSAKKIFRFCGINTWFNKFE